MVRMEHLTEEHDIQELKGLIEAHYAATHSARAKEILDDFEGYLPNFKKIMPVDYNRMLQAIAQMEEKGVSREQAEIDAFYQSVREGR